MSDQTQVARPVPAPVPAPGSSPISVVYSDLDGTMVGPRGCFFRATDRRATLEPARALVDLLAAGVTLVLVSGRTRAQLLEACAIFGADGYVAELGALVGWDGGRAQSLLRGAMPEPYDTVPPEVVDHLLTRYAGRLEYHAPWHLGHEVDVMLRGHVDVAEVEAGLAALGFGWLRVRDNGVLPPRTTALALRDGEPLHVYHLVPDGVGKGAAVAYDLARRGLPPEAAVAVGDSASDLEMAPAVGRFFLVGNGLASPRVRAALDAPEDSSAYDNVTITDGTHGAGWVTAVRAALGTAGAAG